MAFNIVSYSEKSFAVTGSGIKQFRENLKEVGGTTNNGLKNPSDGSPMPGMIFSNKRRTEVEDLIQRIENGTVQPQPKKEYNQRHPQGYGQNHPQGHGQNHPQGHGQNHPQGYGQNHTQGHGQNHPQGYGQNHTQGHGQNHPQGHGQNHPQGHGQNHPQGQERPQSTKFRLVTQSGVMPVNMPKLISATQTVTYTVVRPVLGMKAIISIKDTASENYILQANENSNGYVEDVYVSPDNSTENVYKLGIVNGKWQVIGVLDDHTISFQ